MEFLCIKKQKMLKLKKIWLFLLGIMVVFGFNLQFTHWLPNWDPREERLYRDSTAIISGEVIEEDPMWVGIKAKWDDSKWIINLPIPDDYDTSLWYALALIKIGTNWLLGMLTVVALVYLIYCGFIILSSWTDDKASSKWRKWVKTAAIAIIWIGLSWLIISAIIWFIQVMTDTK